MRKRNALLVLLFPVFLSCLSAQTRIGSSASSGIPGGHRGAVTALAVARGGRILSAGADGFLEIWDKDKAQAIERFQLSPYPIKTMVLRPGKPEVALVESDGQDLYRISAWNYETMVNLFTLRLLDPVSSLNYSGGGNFLIAGRTGTRGAAFIHAETGEVLGSPRELPGNLIFAATGKSEKTMISYTPAGVLSYWDLATGQEIRRFSVPGNISSPVLFGSNRFFAGFDEGGLVVIDAVNGALIRRDPSIRRGILLAGAPEAMDFACINTAVFPTALYHLNLTSQGKLELLARRDLPASFPGITCGAVSEDSAILGTVGGGVYLYQENGFYQVMATRAQKQVKTIAAAGDNLAVFLEDDSFAVIPTDYSWFAPDFSFVLERHGDYQNISADGFPGATLSHFLLWQQNNTRTFPLLKTVSEDDAFVDSISQRFPLRAASLFGNRILLLDSVGAVTVIDSDSRRIAFSSTAPGSLDAAFIDERTIILCGSSGAGSAAFTIIDIDTGETVPLNVPAAVGIKVYRGESGFIYGAAVRQTVAGVETSILRINADSPQTTFTLIDYPGEDTVFVMAECQGVFASTLGGDTASLYSPGAVPKVYPMERSPGLPRHIISGGDQFILSDSEGNITWQDPESGKILALLKIYDGDWSLETKDGVIRGRIYR